MLFKATSLSKGMLFCAMGRNVSFWVRVEWMSKYSGKTFIYLFILFFNLLVFSQLYSTVKPRCNKPIGAGNLTLYPIIRYIRSSVKIPNEFAIYGVSFIKTCSYRVVTGVLNLSVLVYVTLDKNQQTIYCTICLVYVRRRVHVQTKWRVRPAQPMPQI